MKKNKISILSLIFSLLVFSLVFSDLNAQESYSGLANEGEIPRRLLRKFKRDAARLALRMEAEKEDLRYLNISIPKGNIEMIFKVLTSVYKTNPTAQSIAKCNVHTFPNPSIDNFKVVFKRDAAWAEPLRDGISETTNSKINDMLDEYDLIIDNHQKWTEEEDVITIRSKAPLNMAALANEFYNVEDVVEIDLGIPEIGGNDIEIDRVNGGWEVKYILRFGSYFDGNGQSHVWIYKVLDKGGVKFIEETGDPVPDWMKCEIDEYQLALKNR